MSLLTTQVDAYLARRVTLHGLRAWCAVRLSTFLTAPETPDGRLAGAVELGLAELRDGLRTEQSLRLRLKQVLRGTKHQGSV